MNQFIVTISIRKVIKEQESGWAYGFCSEPLFPPKDFVESPPETLTWKFTMVVYEKRYLEAWGKIKDTFSLKVCLRMDMISHVQTHTHTHTHTYIHTYTNTHTPTHTYTYTHPHTHTQIHTYNTRAHTHTHTHTHMFIKTSYSFRT